jgi:hypothetical protein
MKLLKKLVAIELLLREAEEKGLNPYYLAYMNCHNYKTVEKVKKNDKTNYNFMIWNSDAWEITHDKYGKFPTKEQHLETLVELIEKSDDTPRKDWIKQEQKLPEVGRRYKVKDYDNNIKSIILNGKTTVLTIIKLEHVLPYVYFESYRVVDSMRLIEKTKLRLDNFWHNFEELSEQDHIVDENKKVNKEVQEALEDVKLWQSGFHEKSKFTNVFKSIDNLVNALEPKEQTK